MVSVFSWVYTRALLCHLLFIMLMNDLLTSIVKMPNDCILIYEDVAEMGVTCRPVNPFGTFLKGPMD